ncbi:ubiquinone biosynthesis regulatory protein kinase UbiB [Fastidiosibacter lacustris]|uniref:ubiquinone biosynthesis regulatory protein kinase UbiB n=1 Tax=Fastidiosibacter lacustris TaxID=2056695 RepID=UPI000E346800|nr:ubiquinone biosynthesis regulatory protein kinase UbiB [Fastidiosibacter lacustris]
MSKVKKWLRLIYIGYIFNKYNVTAMMANLPLLRALRFTLIFNPYYWLNCNKLDRGTRLRLALETLGPIFIKFGQALSTRRDLLPHDLANELAKLQDKVPPFASEYAIQTIEKALQQQIDKAFLKFDINALASASIAQVHGATLNTGEEVVVKVLRPNIEKILIQDTELLKALASMLERYVPSTRRLRPVEVVAEISRNLLDELDLQREAANASQLKRNFKDSHIHYVPEVYWQYCRNNLLTIEKIKGIPVSDIETLKSLGTDLKLLAERGVEIFYTQVFRDCFFHADMHPGNIFIDASNPKDPKYISIDFGIVGTLTREDQHYLAGNFLAFFNRDYKKVAELHIESGWVPYDTRVDELESAIRTVCEPIFEKPLAEISFGYTLMRLFQVARRFNMSVQPQLVLLQKTLLNIEGLGRDLYPDLNLWATAKPFLEKWMKTRVGWQGFIKRSMKSLPELSERLPDMPELLFELLNTKVKQLKVIQDNNKDERLIKHSKKRGMILGFGLSLIAIGIISSYDIGIFNSVHAFIKQHYELVGGICVVLIIYYWLTRQKD